VNGSGRNSVRIIGGRWRGRRVPFAADPGIRPTPDRVRETLFNWLRNDLDGARCLDLFAGSGALGLESLSRGAATCTFVERSAPAAAMIRSNLTAVGGEGLVLEADALQWLGRTATSAAARRGDQFDLVFLDPPFGKQWLPRVLAALDQGAWVKPGGLVYLECERLLGEPALPAGWVLVKSKFAGEVGYHLARAGEPDKLPVPGSNADLKAT
jgi:16S rRNA (guanine966-N2)-methyltransferase